MLIMTSFIEKTLINCTVLLKMDQDIEEESLSLRHGPGLDPSSGRIGAPRGIW